MVKVEGGRIWLIGGTSESAILANAIARSHLNCTISVATETALSLYPQTPLLRVKVGRMNNTQIAQFIQQEKIVAILDATHPYAVQISREAIALSSKHNIPYLRYERPNLEPTEKTPFPNSQIILLESFPQLLASNYLQGHRVFLTVGYQPLPLFQSWQENATLFARILPSTVALQTALAAGFTPDRLIALRPPIPANLEKELWHHWQISLVVTKASGQPGGEQIKRTLAAELGISLIVISRPPIDYPQQTSDLSTALEFCNTFVTVGAGL